MSTKHLVLVIASLLAAACTSAQSPPPSLTQGEAPRGCPLGVPGGTVVATDTADGIALDFRASDRSGEMRERANDAAAQHGPGQMMGKGHDGKHGEGGAHGLQMMQAPPARTVASDIDGGARIRFVPVDAADLEALRTKVRERAAAMNAASCK